MALQYRQEILDKSSASGHPLEVGAATVVVGAIKARSGEPGCQPAEQRLVARMHAQRHLRLLAVPAKGTFTDKQTNQEPAVELREHRPNRRRDHRRCRFGLHERAGYWQLPPSCFTVMKIVKRPPGGGGLLHAATGAITR